VNRTESALDEERISPSVVDGATESRSPAAGDVVDTDAATRVAVIKPASRFPRLDFGELWLYRELLWTLVWRDVVVRYKQTFLGVAWALLVPIFTAVVYIIVFGRFANFPAGEVPYPALVVGGVLPMQYFASSLTGSSLSLAGNLQLVTKVYFPRALLPLAAVIVPMVDLFVGLPVLIALMWIYETWPGGLEVFAAPLFLGLALITALGAGFFLSALNVRYRDVRYMIPVFL
jgi:lipopolysaccharide transport system permease protein